MMSKPHTGNHGLHRYRHSRYFGNGGIWFLSFAIVIIIWWVVATIYILGGF